MLIEISEEVWEKIKDIVGHEVIVRDPKRLDN